jgi:hypothetical protein
MPLSTPGSRTNSSSIRTAACDDNDVLAAKRAGHLVLRIISPACSTTAIRISSARLPAPSRLENWIDDAEGARLVPL